MGDKLEEVSIPVEVIARNLFDLGFKYTWKIGDYLKGVDSQTVVDSPVFNISVNGLSTKWSLGLRYWSDENGMQLTNPVVICLNLVSACAVHNGIDVKEELQVRYQFGIWNNDAKQYEVCPMGCKSVDVTDTCPSQANLRLQQTACKLQSVGTTEIVILDRHLMHKGIEIFCKIMLVREQVEQNTLALDLWTKLRNGEDCDIKIRTSDGNLIPAHRTILHCRSSLISLNQETIETDIDGQSVIRVDMTTPILTSFLQYVYTDRVDPLDNPQQLLKSAVKFKLPGLKAICEKALIDQISPSTVASLLLIADTYQCDLLKKSGLAYCGENSRSIVKTVSWKVMEELKPKLFEEVCDQM
ncbi:BTB and MATH domain-containing protein 43 [Folsomia candida]|uniref:Protein maternal effect lethal 26 n=1 Tax=Folsomia candida TaxID=158441 RepID=A0A226CWY2_FOLCA|nr:BTB and MATH domain-containing protein 43 [Folsomia candida]OXA37017.1 Protein maternal effect lethal 26 [Folsomia candida]